MDRALLFESARIPESERKEVKQLLEEFDRDRPRILAGIFSALAKALEIEPDLESKKLPRMADFARWGRAISEALGVGDEVFLRLYQDNISQQNEEILSANPVGTALLALMSNETEWDGLISELLSKLEGLCEDLGIDRRSRFWPGAPHILARRIKELEATLAAVGILVELKRSNRGRTVSITKSDGTRQRVASLATDENHWDNKSSASSDATFLPRERDIFNIPSSSVGRQKKEGETDIDELPKSPGSYTSVTSVTPEHAEPCLGLPSEEKPNPETCDGCQHFKPDQLWPRCEMVKRNTNVSHLNRCPLSENSRKRIKATR
jgi:hypothetical protein